MRRILLDTVRRSSSSNSGSRMKFLRQQEAIDIDRELFSTYGFSVDQLMELAGLSCAQAISDIFKRGEVLILAGPGNNGGDGFVCARHLKHFGYSPSILYPKPSKNELMQRLTCQVESVGIPFLTSFPNENSLAHFECIVDALFGFSFRPPIREPFNEILKRVERAQNRVPIVSIDIPSGWDVEKGPPEEGSDLPILSPLALISLTAPKQCAQHFKGRHHFLGGRFVPPALMKKFGLDLPSYEGSSQFLKL
uniref:NAD(P)H-hydrate epimerase n=1 Tax=Globodera rostochiensis TaxID=31243 RepID=A0A914GVZ9_GLORO